jgi:ABC-2 type transport system permease protein
MNKIRFYSLLKKECVRFLKVYNQTIISPVINALIFFLIFTTAFGNSAAGGASYTAIVATGLIIMSALQGAYQNTQATITVAKLLGFIKDYTMTPLTNGEIITAMTLASVIRALIVAIVTYIALLSLLSTHIMCGLQFTTFVSVLLFSRLLEF